MVRRGWRQGGTGSSTDRAALRRHLEPSLYCSSLVEEGVAKAYECLAKLSSDELVSCFSRYIARDSLKHAEFFKEVARALFGDVSASRNECARAYGEAWPSIMRDVEWILSRGEVGLGELSSLIGQLEGLEGLAAEEYLAEVHARPVEFMEGDVDLGHYGEVLRWVAEDEERHRRMLKVIEERLAQLQRR